jgi:hypothetical protein
MNERGMVERFFGDTIEQEFTGTLPDLSLIVGYMIGIAVTRMVVSAFDTLTMEFRDA